VRRKEAGDRRKQEIEGSGREEEAEERKREGGGCGDKRKREIEGSGR